MKHALSWIVLGVFFLSAGGNAAAWAAKKAVPDAGARANWQLVAGELGKDHPDKEMLKSLTNKPVYLRGKLTEHSKAGIKVMTDWSVVCVVLNPMRLETKGREEVDVAVTGRIQSVDILRRTVNVEATGVEIVS